MGARLLTEGFAGAYRRFQEAPAAGDAEGSFHGLFEALNWAHAIDELTAKTWSPRGKVEGYAWRSDPAIGGGEELASVMNGLRYVRNRVHHQWADALVAHSGVPKSFANLEPEGENGGITVTEEHLTTNYQYFGLTVSPGATTLNPGTTECNGVYEGAGKEVVVPAGATCTLTSGTRVSGNVQTTNGATLIDEGAVVGGNVQANSGAVVELGRGGSIGGNLQIQGLAGGPNSLCDTVVAGNVEVHNNGSASPVDIGDLGACTGGPGLTVGGNLQVQNNAASVTVGGNTIKGNLQAQNNAAELTVTGNKVGGNVQVANNSGGGTLTGNNATGNCQLQNDKPPITGSGNTAGHPSTPETCNTAA